MDPAERRAGQKMLRKSLNIAERDADAAEDFADDPTAFDCSTVSLIYKCPQRKAAGIAQAGGFSGLLFLPERPRLRRRTYFLVDQPLPSPAMCA